MFLFANLTFDSTRSMPTIVERRAVERERGEPFGVWLIALEEDELIVVVSLFSLRWDWLDLFILL